MLRKLLIVALLLVFAIPVSAQEETYADPQGRFQVPIPTNWTVNETADFVELASPEATISLYLLVMSPVDDLEAAVAAGWDMVNPELELEQSDTLEPPSSPGIDRTLVVNYELADDWVYQGVAQSVGDTAYLILVEGQLEAVQRRSSQLGIVSSGFEITGVEEADLSAAEIRPVDAAITDALAAYIEELMPQLRIPGAVVAVVQDGAVVYTEAFGVRDRDTGTPMTVDTHMMIGSAGKSLTTTLMATLVDDGLMDWDTPVVEIVPQFSIDSPEVTDTITVKNLVCACTGVPRRDLEFFMNADELTAEDVVESLATFELFTDFGEAFQYSNQMVATGGYVAAAASGAEYGNLYDAYTQQLSERVLQPVMMPDTTLSFDDVMARGAYATPYGLGAGFEYVPLPLSTEAVLLPIAPAGAHWSTAPDMANYVIMQLNTGVAVDGTRVVSEDNLLVTREPQIAVSAESQYGLGWFVDSYKGRPLIHHGGNTLGFTSDVAFLPDDNLGIVVLTNAQAANTFTNAIRSRLFDLVFDAVDAERAAAEMAFVVEQMEDMTEMPETVQEAVDPAVVAAYVGQYTNDALGDLTLELVDDTFYFDAGEFRSRLLPQVSDDDPEVIERYITTEPPLSGLGVRFEEDESGTLNVILGQGVVEYTFTPVE